MNNKLIYKFSLTVQSLFKENSRSAIVKKNILNSFIIKGINIGVNFILVPFLLHYLDEVKYGLLLTIASVIQWLGFFDIGLSNGLRNKFAEAKALDNDEKIKIYISTTYFILFCISIIVILILGSFLYYLDWYKLLNAPIQLNDDLKIVVFITLIFFMIRLVLQVISAILLGDQKSALNEVLNLISNLLILMIIILLTIFYKNSLILASFAISASPIIVYILASIYFFNKDYRNYRPSIKFIQLSEIKVLFNIGVLFFIIQASGIILYSTTNFLITQMFGPSEVTKYNIVYRYFSFILIIFSIIVTPFWSAFTDAFVKKDFLWIHKIIKKLRILGLIFIGILLIMISFSDFFYKIWIGEIIKIKFSLSIVVGIYFIVMIYNMHIVFFLNGIGKIKEQAIMAIIGAVIHIPLSIIIVKKLHLGIEGIILSLIFISLPGLFIYTYLYKNTLKENI